MRLLLVDNSTLFRERLANAFKNREFQVESAANYDEAMDSVRRVVPNMAVVDLRMPAKSGLELVRDLKSSYEVIRILVLSVFGGIATAIDAIRLGAESFLLRLVDTDDILEVFRQYQPSPSWDPPDEFNAPILARAKWEHIHPVLGDCDGNISKAARSLEIHLRSLQRKLKKWATE